MSVKYKYLYIRTAVDAHNKLKDVSSKMYDTFDKAGVAMDTRYMKDLESDGVRKSGLFQEGGVIIFNNGSRILCRVVPIKFSL